MQATRPDDYRWLGMFLLVMLCYGSSTLHWTHAQTTALTEDDQQDAEASSHNAGTATNWRLESPQATLRTFLEAMDGDQIEQAISTLDLSHLDPGTAHTKGASLAVMLKGLFDRMAWIDYNRISSDPAGNEPFVLADHIEDLFNLQDITDAEKICIARCEDGKWQFTRETVNAIEEIWPRWEDRPTVHGLVDNTSHQTLELWLRGQFPKSWRTSHFLIPDYQWVCLLLVIAVGVIADCVVRWFLRLVTRIWIRRMHSDEVNQQAQKLWRPVGLLVQAITWYCGTTLVGLPAVALMVLLIGLKLFAIIAGVWNAFLFIDLLSIYVAERAAKTKTGYDDLLVPLVSRTCKVFVACVGVITLAQAFSLPIFGLLGGLGIGGIAFALASKDAVSNLFGSVTVLVDRPFEIGDWIIIDGKIEGSVETVGFRSTRIRTFYNSQITVPNSNLTTATVDNMGRRRYRRIKTNLGLQYDTKPEYIEAFCEGVREILRRHPYTRKDYYHVYFNGFSENSLDIMLYCFLECPNWSIELREKERLFLDILRLADRLQVQFAFPTRTLHMVPPDHANRQPELDLSQPARAGGKLGAEIAGSPMSGERQPGGVEFPGPQEFPDTTDFESPE